MNRKELRTFVLQSRKLRVQHDEGRKLRHYGIEPMVLTITKDGHPSHPLYVSHDAVPGSLAEFRDWVASAFGSESFVKKSIACPAI